VKQEKFINLWNFYCLHESFDSKKREVKKKDKYKKKLIKEQKKVKCEKKVSKNL
jgi:hypothetical protein